jgi:hypothetical protein
LEYNSTLVISNTTMGEVSVRVVEEYNHLGGMIAADGCMGPEARQRAASSSAAIRPFIKPLLEDLQLSVDAKNNSIAALFNTRLLYDAGA